MIKKVKFGLAISLWFTVLFSMSNPTDTVFVDSATKTISLLPYCNFIQDHDKTMTPLDFYKLQEGKKSNLKNLNLGYTASNNWFKFLIKNSDKSHQTFILEMEYKSVFDLEVYLAGESIGLRSIPCDYQSSSCEFKLAPNKTYTILIKHRAPFSSSRIEFSLWSEKAYYLARQQKIGVHAFFTGICTLVILFSLFLFLLSREQIYLTYLFYVAMLALGILNSQGFLGIIHQLSPSFFGLFMRGLLTSGLSITTLLFVKSLFPSAIIDKVISWLIVSILLLQSISLVIVHESFQYIYIVGAIANILLSISFSAVIVKIILGIRNKEFIAYVYLLSSTPLYIYFLLSVLGNVGINFNTQDLLYAKELSIIVVLIEIITLCFALSSRFYDYKKQRNLLAEQNTSIKNDKIRISKDLHDSTGAQLTFIASYLENLKLNKSEVTEENIEKLRTFTRESLSELRNAIWVLEKENVTDQQLVNKISVYLSQLRPLFPDIEFNVIDQESEVYNFSSHQALTIFRIVQESVNNAVKHAKCSIISIEFQAQKITVTDNGVGFDTEVSYDGNGLINLKERANEINCTLYIDSNTGKGTSIILKIS